MSAPSIAPDVLVAQFVTDEGVAVASATQGNQVMELVLHKRPLSEYEKLRMQSYMEAKYQGKPDHYQRAYDEGRAAGIRAERNRRRRAEYRRRKKAK